MASLVLISINSPLIAGLYENNTLTKHYEIQGHTSAALNSFFGDIFASNAIIDSIFYAKGPGRYSALKSTHIFLHTLSVIKGYALFSTQSFYFNDNAPIHAFGENYFMQENGKMDFVCQQCLIHKILIGKMNHFIFCHLCDCRGSVC